MYKHKLIDFVVQFIEVNFVSPFVFLTTILRRLYIHQWLFGHFFFKIQLISVSPFSLLYLCRILTRRSVTSSYLWVRVGRLLQQNFWSSSHKSLSICSQATSQIGHANWIRGLPEGEYGPLSENFKCRYILFYFTSKCRACRMIELDVKVEIAWYSGQPILNPRYSRTA